MTAQTPTELLAAFVHPVPKGATIPARTPYAWVSGDGGVVYHPNGVGAAIRVDSGGIYWTAAPITVLLPTEIGALVIAHTADNPERKVFVRLHTDTYPWRGLGADGTWRDGDELLDPVPAHVVEGVAP